VTRRRPWLAALLAVIHPGAGHLYLRAWLRALAWFALALLVATVVVPESVVTAFEDGGFGAFYDALAEVETMTLFPLFVVNALNVVDAYLTARRINAGAAGSSLFDRTGLLGSDDPTETADPARPDESAGTCPNCGGELDADLDFCPWCTMRLSQDGEGEEPSVR
jgi:hypothetical protein